MVRQKVKGTGHKQPTDIASEPNFYTMKPVLPLPQASSSGHNAMPTASAQHQHMTTGDNQEYNPLLNSPGIQAATLLKRLSSVGTPSNFSLDDANPPPLASATMSSETVQQSSAIYTLESFRSDADGGWNTSASLLGNATANMEEDDKVERAAEV